MCPHCGAECKTLEECRDVLEARAQQAEIRLEKYVDMVTWRDVDAGEVPELNQPIMFIGNGSILDGKYHKTRQGMIVFRGGQNDQFFPVKAVRWWMPRLEVR